jgi:hypothetical protein
MASSVKLYRFLRPRPALKTIEARNLRVGRLLELNDPFEWRVGVTGIVPEGEIVAQACMDSFLQVMNERIGVVCFSDTVADPVLWSHYADAHRGVAFEVDYLLDADGLQRVQYTDERPVMDATRLNRRDELDAYLLPILERMIIQKAPGWSYEREFRAHKYLKDCETAGGHYFTPIPDDFLRRVILGFRCGLEEQYVRKALDHVGLTDTDVVRAQMDQATYTIKC